MIAIVLTVAQIRRSIIMPFTAPVERLVEIRNMLGPTDEEKEAKAKRTDADGDGLSDWDEANLYRTSSYLRDTDSDGIPDNTEIANQTDPNCPKGQVCLLPSLSATSSASGVGSGLVTGSGMGNGTIVPDRNPASIRAFLKSQGVSDADLANYSDQALLDAYDQSQAAFSGSANAGSSNSSSTSASSSAPTL